MSLFISPALRVLKKASHINLLMLLPSWLVPIMEVTLQLKSATPLNRVQTPTTEIPSLSLEQSEATSWASLLQPKIATGFKVNYIKPNNDSNRITIKLPKVVADEGSKAWENTQIGDFIRKKLPYSLVKNAFSRLWSKAG